MEGANETRGLLFELWRGCVPVIRIDSLVSSGGSDPIWMSSVNSIYVSACEFSADLKMNEAELLRQCQSWVSQGIDNRPDYFFDSGYDFDDCRGMVQDVRQKGTSWSGVVSPSFFTWGTFIMLLLAIVLPYLVVAIYTDFKFRWKHQDDKK